MSLARLSYEEVARQQHVVEKYPALFSVIDQFPDIALVLNQSRQLVHGNQVLLESLGLKNIDKALSLRPGELLQCIHTRQGTDCGDAESCRYCNAFLTIHESQTGKTSVTREARITVQPDHRPVPLDIEITAKPLKLDDIALTMVFIRDISDLKRREYLEDVFIHDVRNTLHVLLMTAEFMETREMSADLRQELASIQSYAKTISEEFAGHRMLMEAEKGTLKVELSFLQTSVLIEECLEHVSKLAQTAQVTVQVDMGTSPAIVRTDLGLARRVLVNALKNAIEATPEHGTVKVQVTGKEKCLIKVSNPGQLPDNVQMQIFQRSFSTKGRGRGLGTYSMRLLLETYLEGSVSFTSNPIEGTSFLITLPLPTPDK